jgi:hemoglobin
MLAASAGKIRELGAVPHAAWQRCRYYVECTSLLGKPQMPVVSRCAGAIVGIALAAGYLFGVGSVAAATSLYERMGGQTVVAAVVEDTLDRVVADPRLNGSFEGSNLRRIKQKLAEQICQLAGGGCQYTGDSMRETHANHQITQAQFYGLVEVLRDSLRRHHVHLRERNELLALLAPMERDVVNVTTPKSVQPPQ